eukprot:GILJ01010221.1.p1 GENE.GILJ01010221.1~~GILJ01010221.1.p1  ORF type:complete len:814 (+),score=82.71 GILJ01010221.1:65-2443(+)
MSSSSSRCLWSWTLVLPPLSTGDLSFDAEQAAIIAAQSMENFLADCRNTDVRLVVIDSVENAAVLDAFRHHLTEAGSVLLRRHVRVCSGSIGSFHSRFQHPPAAFLVNSANWRLKPGGTEVSEELHAIDSTLHEATKAVHPQPAVVGEAFAVRTTPFSPLRLLEGVEYVIHVVCPNMNPAKPDCLRGDYAVGRMELKTCYDRIFSLFYSLASKLSAKQHTLTKTPIGNDSYISTAAKTVDIVVKKESSSLQLKRPGDHFAAESTSKKRKIEIIDLEADEEVGGMQFVETHPPSALTIPVVPKIVSDHQWIQLESVLYTAHIPPSRPIAMKRNMVRVAAFDFDSTLVRTKLDRLRPFPVDANDWQYVFSEDVVKHKLRKLYEDQYLLVIFSNQGGIAYRRAKSDMICPRIVNVIRDLDLPIQVFIATAYDKYRKPRTGMFELLVAIIQSVDPVELLSRGSSETYAPLHIQLNVSKTIDLQHSFFVGDAAGRIEDIKSTTTADYSCSDRIFARDCGIQFHTPEEFFLAAPKQPFELHVAPSDHRTLTLESFFNPKQNDDAPISIEVEDDDDSSAEPFPPMSLRRMQCCHPVKLNVPLSRTESDMHNICEFCGQAKSTVEHSVAIDCEMVGVGPFGKHSIVARISIVNFLGEILYDRYVRPTEKVTNYRTFVSGVRPHHLESGIPFEQAQKEVIALFKGRLLIGHSIIHDFHVLNYTHPEKLVRDTQRYEFMKSQYKGRKLRDLAKHLLGINIQSGEHSSVEDARAALLLYKTFREQWEKDLRLHARRSRDSQHL